MMIAGKENEKKKTSKKKQKRSRSKYEGVFRGPKNQPSKWVTDFLHFFFTKIAHVIQCVFTGFTSQRVKATVNSEIEAVPFCFWWVNHLAVCEARLNDLIKFVKYGPSVKFNDREELERRVGSWFSGFSRSKRKSDNIDLPLPKRQKINEKKSVKKQLEQPKMAKPKLVEKETLVKPILDAILDGIFVENHLQKNLTSKEVIETLLFAVEV